MGKKVKQSKDEVLVEVVERGEPRGARQIVLFAESVEQKEKIRAAAKQAEMSMSGFVIQAVMEAIQK